MKNVAFAGVLLIFGFAFADPSPARVFKSKASQCEVRASAGEYPVFKIYKQGKEVRTIDCDCSMSVLFSPSGKYIAFGNSEMDAFERRFGLGVYDCEKAVFKGYKEVGCSKESGEGACIFNYLHPTKWAPDELSVEYDAHIDGKDSSGNKLKLSSGG